MFKRRYKIFAACFGLLLTAFTAYVMLDTFVIARPVTAVSQAAGETAEVNSADETAGAVQSDSDEQSAETGAETAETDAAAAETGAASDTEADAEADSTAAAEEEESESSRKHRKKPGKNGSGKPGKKDEGSKKLEEDAEDSAADSSDTADNSGNASNSSQENSSTAGADASAAGTGTSTASGADTSAANTGTSTDTTSGTDTAAADADSSSQTAGIGTVMTETSYSDSNMDIELSTYREYDTNIYVAEVSADSAYLKTAFANGTYGKNVTATTSEIAGSTGAILAINGDYYGTQEKGYVVRDGVIYRDTAKSGQEDLVIYSDGSFGFITEGEVTAQELVEAGAEQVLSFGPALVTDGQISVSEGEEVGKAMASNPRTAIAQTADGKYLFVVADGRTDESAGLSLSQLADVLQSLDAVNAYNLDGGGSSTMVFNGNVINNPTTGGRIKERSVSDIVYIGY